MMVVYEIHTFRDAAWKIDSVFDDRDLAVLEALRVERTSRNAAVRVVEESIDEATERTVTRTIYRTSKVDKNNFDPQPRDDHPADVGVSSAAVASSRAGVRAAPGGRVALLVTLVVAAVICSGLGALYAFNSFTP
jgi:hypothetical protein